MKNLFPAHLDGETVGSERLILEQHVRECAECRATLENHPRRGRISHEAPSPDRLRKDLAPQVMAHLPEMDMPHALNHALTQRVKHPEAQGPLGRMRTLLPVFAPVLVVALGLVLWAFCSVVNSPRPAEMRAWCFYSRVRFRSTDFAPQRRDVHASDSVITPVRYETGHDGGLILGLLDGKLEVRVFPDSRVKVYNAREFRLESGPSTAPWARARSTSASAHRMA